jgi:hypothetical protein
MGRIKGWIIGAAVISVIGVLWFLPRPEPAHVHESEGVPEEWTRKVNRTDPGEDWRKIEAASLMELSEAGGKKSGGVSFDEAWTERGPSTIPGRITDIDIGYADQLIYCVTDHGIVFRGNLDGTDWKPLNDQHPVSQGVGCFLQVIRLADGIRILSGSG